MAISGLISILMRADTRPLARGAKDATGILQRMSGQMRLMNTLQVGGMAFNAIRSGAGAASSVISRMVNAASDLNEQMSATGATFGGSSSTIIKAAEQQASAFGIVKSEYLEAANGLGAIFKASGLSEQAAAQMSVKFTNLATDLSSFRNLDFPDALQKIRAGLVGEAEPLRTVGVLLSEGAVKSEAYRSGIAKTGQELTEAQKVQARAAIIARQLSDANGDLARTATGPANAMRAIQGRAINMAADFGRAIQPITQAILGGVNMALADMSGALSSSTGSISQWAQQSIKAGGFVNNAIKAIGSGLAMLADGAILVLQTFSAVLSKLLNGLSSVYFIGGAFEGAATEFANLNGMVQQLQGPGNAIRSTFDKIAASTANMTVNAETGASAIADTGSRAMETAKAVDDLNKKLDDQVKYFGLVGAAEEVAKLRDAGANSEQLQGAAGKALRLREMENAKGLAERRQESMVERMKSPFAGLARAGSREMFSLDLFARTGQGGQAPDKETAKNTRETNLLLAQLKAILANRPAPTTELAMVP